MDFGSILYEIDGIDKELARLRKKTSELNKRKKDLMTQAIEDMKESGETSVVHKGKTYTLEERPKHGRKTDKKKREDTLSILADEGFNGEEAEEMYNKLTGAMKGPETVIYKLAK